MVGFFRKVFGEALVRHGDGESKITSWPFDAAVHQLYVPSGPPSYDPGIWNVLREEFNCYSYALRLSDHGWGHPGQLMHKSDANLRIGDFLADNVHRRLTHDGLVQVAEHGCDFLKNHVIAAFLDPDRRDPDFHFYSLDADGRWSHKCSDKIVEREDARGRPILYPREASRRYGQTHYRVFLGFYVVPEKGIPYYPRIVQVTPQNARGFQEPAVL